jgi:glycosyltransferase involved in cell wall biosynthesis
MKVSVIIKALNEEANIERAITSALDAIRHLPGGGEVILADSLSGDRTIELASAHPVRIVQLLHPSDRCCGVGAELGYRAATGDYVYILDADMALHGEFLVAAVQALEQDASLAGVGGRVQEMNIVNAEFRGRTERLPAHMKPGLVDRLNMGGLYRQSAIRQSGYLTNRNLHSFEEVELAIRLRTQGWRLLRLDMPAVQHYGHTDASFRLLWRRWRSGYAWGLGELLRELRGTPYLRAALTGVALYRQVLLVFVWWLAVAGSALVAVAGAAVWWLPAVIAAGPVLLAMLRRRSVADGVYLVSFLSLYAAGTVRGFLQGRRGEPQAALAMRSLK